MKEINEIIAENLRLYRKQSGYSLEYLSVLSEVSKTMLGQIERKESIPSITTLWKIANGLKLSLTELTQENTEYIQKISISDLHLLSSKDNKCEIYPFFKFDIDKKFESYMAVFNPGGVMKDEPHGSGSKEYITVYEGVLSLELDGEKYIVKENESIKFNANMFHVYANEHHSSVRCHIIVHY